MTIALPLWYFILMYSYIFIFVNEYCVFTCLRWTNSKQIVFTFPRPRDAVKAIKKRIVGNKNFREIMLALTVSIHLYVIVCKKFYSFFHEFRNAGCESVIWRPEWPLSWLAGGLEEMLSECILTQAAKSTLKSQCAYWDNVRDSFILEQLEPQRFKLHLLFLMLWTCITIIQVL